MKVCNHGPSGIFVLLLYLLRSSLRMSMINAFWEVKDWFHLIDLHINTYTKKKKGRLF